MKFDTHKDQQLDTSASVDCFLHENKYISQERKSDEQTELGRNVYYQPTAIFTPVVSAERIKRPGLVDVNVDDLAIALGDLLLGDVDDSKNVAPETDPETNTKEVSPSTKRLIIDAPEACNPSLGRCKQSMVHNKTMQVVEVTRSMRLVGQQRGWYQGLVGWVCKIIEISLGYFINFHIV